jgi:flavin-dependent dehydrogenase
VIVGGGLSGLIAAIMLARKQIAVTVVEKKSYPLHRVCGEYVSNETAPFLQSTGLYPEEFRPAQINELELTSVNGKSVVIPLEMGGFGISRFTFDNFLYEKALNDGVTFVLNQEADLITASGDHFDVRTGQTSMECDAVIGAFGKRSRLDSAMQRAFLEKRSPYAGIKYHVYLEHAANRIALHNFRNGYCGMSRVEDGKTNLCYLTHRDNLRAHRNIAGLEEAVLFENPFLKKIFRNAEFIFDKPEVINEISFSTKEPVQDHVLMAGDAAGMITPLCGNGMAMAIHSAKIASACVFEFMSGMTSRNEMESGYTQKWRALFARRLWVGRQVQRLFGSKTASNFAVNLAHSSRSLTRRIVEATHGDAF